MGSSSFSLILLGVMILAGGLFFLFTKDKNNTSDSKSKNKSDSGKAKKTTTNPNDIKKDDVFKFMEFDKIQDDMIVQNKGTKYTMAVKCKGINYELMSDVEQMAVEEGFITFLNTLKYPIQLYVQAQNIDLKGAINTYKENIAGIKQEYAEADAEYVKVTEAFESTQLEIDEAAQKRDEVLNVYEYANDIISYVEKMSNNKNLLQRSFYVLISYYTSEINSAEKFSKDELANLCYTELFTRAQGVISALASCSVEGRILNSNELADLLYTAYNRDDRGLMNVKEALESGFYRLYSTSVDAFQKRQEMLENQIEDAAKAKAYQAIYDSLNDGSYVSDKSEVLKADEQASRLANEIIKRENIPTPVKEAAQEKVVEQYRQDKKQILAEIEKEKEQMYEEAQKELGITEPKKLNENPKNDTRVQSNNVGNQQNNVVNNPNVVVNNNGGNGAINPNAQQQQNPLEAVFRDENNRINYMPSSSNSENDSII